MNPAQYLHLEDTGIDIRPSKIAVYYRNDSETGATQMLCIDFQDGRWHELAEEPYNRMKNVLQQSEKARQSGNPFVINLVLLTCAHDCWTMSLDMFNKQLIAYVGDSVPSCDVI